MKKIILFAFLGIAQTVAFAQAHKAKSAVAPAVATNWSTDATHSAIRFSVSHMTISSIDGSFKTFTGTLASPAADFNNAQINFTVDVNSINTDNDMRDKHLKSDDFFSADKFPKMTFVSTSFKKFKGNTYMVQGNLTIKNVTKKITLPVIYGGTVKDSYGNTRAGFKASGKISRKEYGLKYNQVMEAGGAVVGDEVTFTIAAEFIQQK